jgi:hypothetical protein
VCFHLYLASPLTLSEVRSMLPEGLTADLVLAAEHRFFASHLHPTRTAVQLRRGGCACDLAGQRHPDREEDERGLRARYRREGTPRDTVIRALERHRNRPAGPPVGPVPWVDALAAFVVEHARNAGPALYYLSFSAGAGPHLPWKDRTVIRTTAAEVRDHPADWLGEGQPIIVQP